MCTSPLRITHLWGTYSPPTWVMLRGDVYIPNKNIPRVDHVPPPHTGYCLVGVCTSPRIVTHIGEVHTPLHENIEPSCLQHSNLIVGECHFGSVAVWESTNPLMECGCVWLCVCRLGCVWVCVCVALCVCVWALPLSPLAYQVPDGKGRGEEAFRVV